MLLTPDRARIRVKRSPLMKEAIVARSKNGQAVSAARRTVEERMQLAVLLETARAAGDLHTWRRAKALTDYLNGTRVIELAKQLDVARSSINTWLRAYETEGVEGLRTGKPPGATPRLSPQQREELKEALKAGPQAAGFTSGVWTGPMVREYVLQHFSVGYHNHHLPRLLHQLGFSVQRPRKRLARADPQAQAVWSEERLPAIKKSAELWRRSALRG
jgi:putative transposase